MRHHRNHKHNHDHIHGHNHDDHWNHLQQGSNQTLRKVVEAFEQVPELNRFPAHPAKKAEVNAHHHWSQQNDRDCSSNKHADKDNAEEQPILILDQCPGLFEAFHRLDDAGAKLDVVGGHFGFLLLISKLITHSLLLFRVISWIRYAPPVKDDPRNHPKTTRKLKPHFFNRHKSTLRFAITPEKLIKAGCCPA